MLVKAEMQRRLFDVFLGMFVNKRRAPSRSRAAMSACSELLRKVIDRVRYVRRRKAAAELRGREGGQLHRLDLVRL